MKEILKKKQKFRWLSTVDVVLAAGIAAILACLVVFSVFTTILLLLGNLSWPLLLMIAVPVSVAVIVLIAGLYHENAKQLLEDKYRVQRVVSTLALLVFLILWGGFNMKFTSEHILVNRDPGIYTLGALHLSQNDNLNISSENEFGESAMTSSYAVDVSEINKDEMYFQGSHLLPALIGLGGRVVGSEHVYHLNILFGMTALLAVFFFASRMMRPFWALVAVGAMAAAMPMLYFSRDMYTEPLAASFTFAGMGLLWLATEFKSRSLWLLAGLTVGASALTRIDGYLAIAATLAFVVCYVAFADDKRIEKSKSAALFVGGAAITGFLGWMDLYFLSSGYLFDLHKQFAMQMIALVAAIVIGSVIVWTAWKTRLFIELDKNFKKQYTVIISLVTVATVLVLASRQFWDETTNHLGRDYNELAPLWLGWYLGDVLVTLGVIGAALAIYYALAKKQILYAIPASVIILTCGVYLISPNIAPDQVWASRRLLPVIMPGIVVFAFFATQIFADKYLPYLNGVKKGLIWVLQIGIAGVLVMQPLMISKPMLLHAQYRQRFVMESFCNALPSSSAVVWVGTGRLWAVQATEEVCHTSSAGLEARHINSTTLRVMEENLKKRGFGLVIAVFGDDLSPSPVILQSKDYQPLLDEDQKRAFSLAASGVYEGMEAPVDRAPVITTSNPLDIYYAKISGGALHKVDTGGE